jgi:hypothetical protein
MTTAELCAAIGPVTVELDPHDAITAGASMIILAHSGRMPDERTQEIYLRVGQVLTAAVRAKQLGGGQ